MSLKIKIPKLVNASSRNEPAMSSTRKRASRRSTAEYEDDDYEAVRGEGSGDDVEPSRPSRRARADFTPDEEDIDVDAEGEVDVEAMEDDTRFLPQAIQSKPKTTPKNSRSRQRADAPLPSASRRRSTGKVKRAVVYSDDEDEEQYDIETERVDADDDDFELEPAPKRSGLQNGGRSKTTGGRPSKAKTEKEIVIKDERRLATSTPSNQGTKRLRPKEEEDLRGGSLPTATSEDAMSRAGEEADPTPPPVKKRKLPPIKKIKSATGSTASSTSTPKPTMNSLLPKKEEGTVRKVAASLGSHDFDLRDASVYAQLFTKPNRATPNSGLNRKEKEEERKKELNKMREEARAKRAEEEKHSFDLQASHDKIARFEDRLRQRKSLAAYPNILGASFKDAYDRAWRPRRT